MAPPDLLKLFAVPLSEAGIRHMIAGSVASTHYGEPRFTADIDIAAALSAADTARLARIFAEPDFYCPPPEVLEVEVTRQERAHFNIIHIASGLKADFYPCTNQPLFLWALANVRRVKIDGHSVAFAPPEYVILWKLLFYREGRSEKHLHDIASILQTQEGRLDNEVLAAAIRDQRLETEWATVSKE